MSRITAKLIDSLAEHGVGGRTLLDIGGGVGVIPLELLEQGLQAATLVEASGAAAETAKAEASDRGINDRLVVTHGDYVAMADTLPIFDFVTLDRSICCYPDVDALVGLASAHTGQVLAAAYPRDVWWVRIGTWLINLGLRLRRTPFRVFVHSPARIDAIVQANGLVRRSIEKTKVWEISIFQRS
ncbi:MAG: hypothetical protein WBR18_07940 [Anaerolineales bacterium]